jgi:hypothetical protein
MYSLPSISKTCPPDPRFRKAGTAPSTRARGLLFYVCVLMGITCLARSSSNFEFSKFRMFTMRSIMISDEMNFIHRRRTATVPKGIIDLESGVGHIRPEPHRYCHSEKGFDYYSILAPVMNLRHGSQPLLHIQLEFHSLSPRDCY